MYGRRSPELQRRSLESVSPPATPSSTRSPRSTGLGREYNKELAISQGTLHPDVDDHELGLDGSQLDAVRDRVNSYGSGISRVRDISDGLTTMNRRSDRDLDF